MNNYNNTWKEIFLASQDPVLYSKWDFRGTASPSNKLAAKLLALF